MSEENTEVVVESAAAPEVQAEAQKIGWIPPERYKGPADRFVDADEYIKRGETVLPIVKKQNQELRGQVETLSSQNQQIAAALRQAQDAIADIQERNTVATQKAVEQARAELKAQLTQASRDGDHEAVAELTEQMTQIVAAGETAPPAKEVQQQPAAPVITPEQQAWNAENPWFSTDQRKTALFLVECQELRKAGNRNVGTVFFNEAKEAMEKTLGIQTQHVDKVSGNRNGGEGDTRAPGGKKGFASLPAEAKAAARADERDFVGPGKRYKTAAEWHQRYAEIYFADQT